MLCAGHSGAYKQLCWSSTQRVTGSNSLWSRPKGFSRAGKAAKPPQHPSGQRSQLPLSPARFPRLLPSRSQCAAAPNEFSGKQIKGRGYITQQTAQPAPGCAGKPCLGFLGCATLLAAAAGKPAAPTRTRCSNNLIKAAQYRWLLSDGRGRARAPGNLPLLRGFLAFCPPCAKPQTNKTRGKQRRLQWVLRQRCRGLWSQEIPVPAAWTAAGPSTGRPGVSRRGRDILPAGKSSSAGLGFTGDLGSRILLAQPHRCRFSWQESSSLHQVCPSIKSFPRKPSVPPTFPSLDTGK